MRTSSSNSSLPMTRGKRTGLWGSKRPNMAWPEMEAIENRNRSAAEQLASRECFLDTLLRFRKAGGAKAPLLCTCRWPHAEFRTTYGMTDLLGSWKTFDHQIFFIGGPYMPTEGVSEWNSQNLA